jgi:hypothetical protein
MLFSLLMYDSNCTKSCAKCSLETATIKADNQD